MSSDQFLTHLDVVRNLAGVNSDSAREQLSHFAKPEWEAFLDFLKEHRLREFFSSAIKDARIGCSVPGHVRDKLVRYCDWSRKKADKLAKLQSDAEAAFRQHGVPCLVLKGTYLTARFHPAGFERHQGDVDLLVREQDVPTAVRALQSIDAHLRRNKQTLSLGRVRSEHAASLTRGDCSVDLHWMLRPGPGYRISMEHVWRDRQAIDSARETVSDEYLIVLLCVSLAGDLGRGGVRLKSLLDAHYVFQKLAPVFETEEFWQRREQEGIARICRHVLTFVDEVFSPKESAKHNEPRELIKTREAALRLMTLPRNSVENFLWLAKIHRLWKPSAAWWFLSKNVQHPGRLPNAIGRWLKHSLRFLAWTVTPRKKFPVQKPAQEKTNHRRAA